MQGGSHFSYNAVNFHPEVRIYWKTLPLAGWQSLFLHCSKLPSWSENLLKNLTTCRAAVTFPTLQQTSTLKWESIEKPYHLQGGSHFSYIAANFPEVRIYWKTLPLARQQSLFLHCSNLPWISQKKIQIKVFNSYVPHVKKKDLHGCGRRYAIN